MFSNLEYDKHPDIKKPNFSNQIVWIRQVKDMVICVGEERMPKAAIKREINTLFCRPWKRAYIYKEVVKWYIQNAEGKVLTTSLSCQKKMSFMNE